MFKKNTHRKKSYAFALGGSEDEAKTAANRRERKHRACWLLALTEKRKMATKWVPRARFRVSTPELAIMFRGGSVSGHPGARGGQKVRTSPGKISKNQGTLELCLGVLLPYTGPPLDPIRAILAARLPKAGCSRATSRPNLAPAGPNHGPSKAQAPSSEH